MQIHNMLCFLRCLEEISQEIYHMKLENIDLVEENHINAQACLNVVRNIFIAILASAALIGGALAVRNKIHATKAQTELVQKADTLKDNIIKNIK